MKYFISILFIYFTIAMCFRLIIASTPIEEHQMTLKDITCKPPNGIVIADGKYSIALPLKELLNHCKFKTKTVILGNTQGRVEVQNDLNLYSSPAN